METRPGGRCHLALDLPGFCPAVCPMRLAPDGNPRTSALADRNPRCLSIPLRKGRAKGFGAVLLVGWVEAALILGGGRKACPKNAQPTG